jgi:hypothetical protein
MTAPAASPQLHSPLKGLQMLLTRTPLAVVAIISFAFTAQSNGQDTLIGVYQGAKTVVTSTRLDAESGAVFQVPRTQITMKTDKGIHLDTAASRRPGRDLIAMCCFTHQPH